MSASSNPIRRCAVYTRKSSEEGLEQDFNSLHAQREACEAYIRSQGGEGWRLVKAAYDDGGLSGGNMERPALQRLLADIRQKQVDLVVVYKVDRLTRSLMDFAKIVEEFDRHGVSIVAVTQQFNTTTSMGRLTLNVLLSFAQFEREVTAERIRDKIAASKRKGMWMGGNVPLGYNVQNRKLVVNQEEARTVRLIYDRYLELGCVRLLQQDLERRGIRSKVRVSIEGKRSGGRPFSRGALYTLLANPIYVGDIRHKAARYEGQHAAVLKRMLWDAVQQKLKDQGASRKGRVNTPSSTPLAGKLFDERGEPLTPSHTVKQGRRYRYYVSRRLVTGTADVTARGWRLPAREIERVIAAQAAKILEHPVTATELIKRNDAGHRSAQRQIQELKGAAARLRDESSRDAALSAIVDRAVLAQGHVDIALIIGDPKGNAGPSQIVRQRVSLTLKRKGVEMKLLIGEFERPTNGPNPALIKLVSRAYRWWERLATGPLRPIEEIARNEGLSKRYVLQILQIAFAAPSLVEKVVAGSQHDALHWDAVMATAALPISWREQCEYFLRPSGS
jgi:DNA invertase Pin-like site-specific DNA recombinase